MTFAFLFLVLTAFSKELDPDVGRDMIEISISKGYPMEEHFVTTEDGYILGVFRIPYGRNESSPNANSNVSKPVVLLQHGLLDSSFTWVNNPVYESLAFILADHGYDVWLGNSRGNTYSKRHAWLHTNTDEFWNFTWDEMGHYDAPNTIDYILEWTNASTLAYVGHSQGTIQMFAMPYYRPDIIKDGKLAFFGALAPIAYVNHQKSPLLELLAYLDIAEIYQILGRKQFLPGVYLLNEIAPEMCNVVPQECESALWLLCGPSQDLNASRIEVYVSETPADTSVKNMIHWSQGVKKNKFEMFDYGSDKKNEEHYGQKTPPQYDLQAVNMNLGLYSGTNDWLADPKDVQHLREDLPSNSTYGSIVQDIVIDGFDHLDFVWGMEANTTIYLAPNLMAQITRFIGPGQFNH